MKESKGYEKLDVTEICEDEYKQKQKRLSRVNGYGDSEYYGRESGETIDGGFIRRNNVRDQS